MPLYRAFWGLRKLQRAFPALKILSIHENSSNFRGSYWATLQVQNPQMIRSVCTKPADKNVYIYIYIANLYLHPALPVLWETSILLLLLLGTPSLWLLVVLDDHKRGEKKPFSSQESIYGWPLINRFLYLFGDGVPLHPGMLKMISKVEMKGKLSLHPFNQSLSPIRCGSNFLIKLQILLSLHFRDRKFVSDKGLQNAKRS